MSLPALRSIFPRIDKIDIREGAGKELSLSVLRLDTIHPGISGNKFFKLFYFLQRAMKDNKQVITFGGAWSNHLYATAAACSLAGIKCRGIVRGEKPAELSSTLLFCIEKGMDIEFISREKYGVKTETTFKEELREKYGDHILIPEGGFSEEGRMGAAFIADYYESENFTHICCAAGTATTLAGLISKASSTQFIMGFSALKNMDDFEDRICNLVPVNKKNYTLISDYHFGGFAKKNEALILFMNRLYETDNIPTDIVYTGKMMFGVFDLIKKKYFPPGSNILCVHTGGLQGNLSLKEGILNF